jgi:hypothetical protein
MIAIFVFTLFMMLWLGWVFLAPFILCWVWNLFLPLVWKTAPHLTYWPAFAGLLLISIIGGLFRRS